MKKNDFLLLLAAVMALMPRAQATTVIPPSFDELVNHAEVIFQGAVTGLKSQWVGEGAQRHIVSYVTFQVDDAIKGNPGPSYTIRMFGGTVDGFTMGASDAPKFKIGDRDILFVENNGSQFVPLVGIMHGRFHVRKGQAGEDIVTTNDEEPVKNVGRLGRQNSAAPSSSEPNLTTSEFKSAVKSKLQVAQ
jgi:hypothetical protein